MATTTTSSQQFEELNEAGVDALVASISIPPRPSLLQDLQAEIAKPEPDLQVIASITAKDVALTAAVLKVINSPFYGLRRQVDSIAQATSFLGLKPVATLVTGLVARQAIKDEGPAMTRFWDVSTKRAFTVKHIARKLRLGDTDLAQTFGLFCDMGIPLLSRKFPTYLDTLGVANTSADKTFTEVERSQHQTDHALIGAIMAKTWGLSPMIAMAIRAHHDYTIFSNDTVPDAVKDLVAMGLLAEKIIQDYTGQNKTAEWERGGAAALAYLSLSAYEFEELRDDMHDAFGGA